MHISRSALPIPFVALLTASVGFGAPSAEGKVRVRDYTHHSKFKPDALKIAFGPTTSSVMRITGIPRWHGWGSRSTRAHGTLHYNSCRPSCANGHIRHRPTKVKLYRIHSCNGQRVYGSVRIRPHGWPTVSADINCAGNYAF